MSDPFESGNRGPGEEAHEGFKIFGMSVNQFSAAVAGFDTLKNALDKQVNRQAKENASGQKAEADVAKTQSEAAKTQAEAADTNKDIAKEAKKLAKQSSKSEAKAWGSMMLSTRSIREAADLIKLGAEELGKNFSHQFKATGEKVAGTVGDGLKNVFGKFSGVISNLGGIVKSFAGRFIVVFTLVNILTRVLEQLVNVNTMEAQSRRAFGNQAAGGMGSLYAQSVARSAIPLEPEEFLQITRSLNKELTDSSRMTAEMVVDVKQLARGLNMDVGAAAEFVGRALRTTDATAGDVYATFADVAEVAAQVGLNVDELTQSLAANVDLAQQFNLTTEQGRLQLARSAAEARLLGTDLTAVRGFGDQFFDISTAAETAAKMQAMGLQGFDASRLVTGALDNPADLMRDLVVGIEKQYGALAATGDDRAVISMLMQQLPQLGELFGSIEGVSKALGVASSGDLSKVGEKVAAAQARADEAKNFELNALDQLRLLVTQGDSLETAVNDFATKLSHKLASFIQGPFNDLVELIRKLVTMLSESSLFQSTKRKGIFRTGEAKQRDDDAKATTKAATQYLENKLRNDASYFDTNKDNNLTADEISAVVSKRAEFLREQGAEITAEQQNKMIKAVLDLAADLRSSLDRDQKITITGVNGRNLMDGYRMGVGKE